MWAERILLKNSMIINLFQQIYIIPLSNTYHTLKPMDYLPCTGAIPLVSTARNNSWSCLILCQTEAKQQTSSKLFDIIGYKIYITFYNVDFRGTGNGVNKLNHSQARIVFPSCIQLPICNSLNSGWTNSDLFKVPCTTKKSVWTVFFKEHQCDTIKKCSF